MTGLYNQASAVRLSTMSLAEKVGQVMMIGLDPTATSASYTGLTARWAT